MKKQPITITVAPRSIFLVFFLAVFSFLLLRLTGILLLIFFSLLFAAALHPSVVWLMRKLQISKALAIALLYVGVIAIAGLIIISVVPAVTNQIESLIRNLPDYQQSLNQHLSGSPSLQQGVANAFDKLSQNSGTIVSHLASITVSIVVTLFAFITLLILTAYFLAGGKQMAVQAFNFLPEPAWRQRAIVLAERISHRLGYWLRGQLVVSTILFFGFFISLSLLGVPYALVLALLAGLLETIPAFGAWISGILATLVALTVSPGRAIATAIMILIFQQVQSNVITPQIMKRALGIPAASIIISLLIFGKLFGLIGVLLAAPMAAIVAILGQEFAPEGRRLWPAKNQTAEKEG